MAILEDVPGVEVTVQINGQNVTEYPPNQEELEAMADADRPTACSYIECHDDTEFAIRIAASSDYNWGFRDHRLRLNTYIDGKYVHGKLFRQHSSQRSAAVKGRELYCQRSKQWLLHKFEFSAVSTVDDSSKERVKDDMKIAKHLGVIEVEVSRVIHLGRRARGSQHSFTRKDKIEVTEKALKGKAISHGMSTSVGEIVENPTLKSSQVDDIPEDDGPIGVFRFHYRSRDALKREMIIPRSLSPSPDPPSLPSIETMSQVEIQRLAQERLDQMRRENEVKQERKPAMKREPDEFMDLTGNSLVQRSPKRRRQAEFVDLTDD
ncbi:Uu.00g000310.m01.CDS01 [Anthostomella pinea]|uniref:Uu.00g000310.m01.CDS01 n=1 Tax=Anthostomella pinea TaxID=933095 RepID=A0AAI8VJS8_9PEZI|nr:Uu.00g000310.m01.CDS01 [Anthostomella pinea]